MSHLSFSKISVLGLGYIGLPTAAILASKKLSVLGIDIDQNIVNTINRGQIHIIEPELDQLVRAVVEQGTLRASLVPEPAQAFIIAVPTPFKQHYQPDRSYIFSACDAIAPLLVKGNLIILESTSPVGTTEEMAHYLAKLRRDLSFPQTAGGAADIHIAYCPERVLPGQVLKELVQNDRVIGGMTVECSQMAASLYKNFVEGSCIISNCRTAELCKLAENSYRDVNIAFANELSMICDSLDINVWDLISLANRHPRVSILQPGPGVGGHCIAVDPWFIVSSSPEQARLIRTAREVNNSKPAWVLDKVKLAIADYLQGNPSNTAKDLTLACFGLSFKPNIDDLRESPALDIVQKIVDMHAGFTMVIEPHISALPKVIDAKAQLCSIEQALEEADILIMLVNHKLFSGLKAKVKPGALICAFTSWE